MFELTASLGVLVAVVGCASRNGGRSQPDPDYGAISYGEWSAFGSVAAGGLYLDTDRSAIVPEKMLTKPGQLEGHWLVPDRLSALVVESVAPESDDFEGHFLNGRPGDCFKITIRDGTDQRFFAYLQAAYGAFVILGADVDGDGIDEVVIEYGEGRGTFAYTRKLLLCEAGPHHILSLFDADLSGYIGGEPQDKRSLPDPDVWARRYLFADLDSDGVYEIVLHLIPPKALPHHMASTDYTNILQFPKQVYGLNQELHTYELRDFTFRPLKPPIGRPGARSSAE